MFFIQVALKALETPGKPFIHEVNATALVGARKPFANAIASRRSRLRGEM
jgi:hypothetical protein